MTQSHGDKADAFFFEIGGEGAGRGCETGAALAAARTRRWVICLTGKTAAWADSMVLGCGARTGAGSEFGRARGLAMCVSGESDCGGPSWAVITSEGESTTVAGAEAAV